MMTEVLPWRATLSVLQVVRTKALLSRGDRCNVADLAAGQLLYAVQGTAELVDVSLDIDTLDIDTLHVDEQVCNWLVCLPMELSFVCTCMRMQSQHISLCKAANCGGIEPAVSCLPVGLQQYFTHQ